jgi:hypothetical protein
MLHDIGVLRCILRKMLFPKDGANEFVATDGVDISAVIPAEFAVLDIT